MTYIQKKISTVLIAILLLFVFSLPTYASVNVDSSSKDDLVITISGTDQDKETAIEEAEQIIDEFVKSHSSGIQPLSATSRTLTAKNTKNYSDGTYYATFTSDWGVPFITKTYIKDGTTKALWTGKRPMNADKVTLTDKIKITGLSISLNVGASSSGSITTTKDTTTWKASQTNAFSIYHYYSGFTATGTALWSVTQTATGEFKFGNQYYEVTANDSFIL